MRGSLEPDRLKLRLIAGVAALLLFPLIAPAQQANQSSQLIQSGQSGQVRIIAQDEAGNPVSGASVQIKRNNEIASAIVTNEKGEAATNLVPGKYEIVISKEGFETRTQNDVALTTATHIEV